MYVNWGIYSMLKHTGHKMHTLATNIAQRWHTVWLPKLSMVKRTDHYNKYLMYILADIGAI